jgi:hypothetical protein
MIQTPSGHTAGHTDQTSAMAGGRNPADVIRNDPG